MWKFNLGGGTLQATGNLTINSSSFFTMALTANGSTIDTQGNTVTINTPINGAYSLTKIGSGTLVLGSANGFGITTISAGTLQVGSGGTTGSLGSGAVADNGSLVFNRSNAMTVSNAISGSRQRDPDRRQLDPFRRQQLRRHHGQCWPTHYRQQLDQLRRLTVPNGTVSQSGYTMTAASEVVGNLGNGYYLQSGGTNIVSGAESLCIGLSRFAGLDGHLHAQRRIEFRDGLVLWNRQSLGNGHGNL